MPTTIIGPTAAEFPSQAAPAIVEVKAAWSDAWRFAPELEFMRAAASTAAHDLDHCTLLRRYGELKHPWEPDSSYHAPASLLRYWVRVRMAGQQGLQTVWVGRISGEGRVVFGSDNGPAGTQELEAYGPLQILRKIHVGRSYWWVDGAEKEIGWLPPINQRPGSPALCGNRSALDHGQTYLYGGSELWTWRQYAEYVLHHFVDESGTSGPRWTLGGDDRVLGYFNETIHWKTTQTAAEILAALIRPEFGMDYKIIAGDDGFEVSVFMLTSEATSYGGVTLPGNIDRVRIEAGRSAGNLTTQIARVGDHRYGTIRVLGGRVVICCSLRADDESLAAGWTNGLEDDYKAGFGPGFVLPVGFGPPHAPMAEDHDLARKQEKFAAVYQRFLVAKDWDFNGGEAAPKWDNQGKPAAGPADFQREVRGTLNWLPLVEGFDYTTDPPGDLNPEGHQPGFVRPMVFVYQPIDGGEYSLAEKVGMSVHVLPNELGVYIQAGPNHRLAKDAWDGAAASDTVPSWRWWNTVATLAFESDERIVYERALPDAAPSDGVLEIDASDCQFWYLCADTCIDVDSDGSKLVVARKQWLRCDWTRMTAVMAGAIARHFRDRARAQIVCQGFLPWGGLLGQMLTVIDDGGDAQTIQSAITSVAWQGGERPSTIISTGFASNE